MVLRFIYPEVEPPKFTDVQLLSVLLTTADKYNVASMRPVVREALKAFIPGDSFSVFAIAC